MKLNTIASVLFTGGFTVLPTPTGASRIVSNAPRTLQETVETNYSECVRQAMGAEDCATYIQSLLGGESLPNSPYPNARIKISRPRTPEAKAATYWEVGIPVNIRGEVSCDINGGAISYPHPWVIDDSTSYTIPDTNCAGLDAATCCAAVKANVADAGIPLVDQNGNCLSCWVHQEYLIPDAPPQEGTDVTFLNYEYVAQTTSCVENKLTTAEVQAIDEGVEAELDDVVNAIDSLIDDNSASCDQLKNLQSELYIKARSFVHAMVPISSILCGLCEDGETSYNPLPASLVEKLTTIRNTINNGEVKSDEIVIVIYVDHGNLVMEPPEFGGSRAELDFDRDDPIVSEGGDGGADGDPELYGDENGGGDQYTPPDDLRDPDEIYYHYDVTDVDPDDPDHRYCRPVDLMNGSKEKGAPCFKCRKCLLKKCDWQNANYCRKLLKFKITEDVTVENWVYCLETNGGLIEKEITDNDGTFTNWCSCARKCEQECIVENVDDLPPPDEVFEECTAKDMALKSGDGESCNDCKTCLQEKCDSWDHRVCNKILSGKRRGTKEKWFACLRSNGATSSVPDTLIYGKGKRNTWSACARECDDRCHKVKTIPAPADPEPDESMCSASDLATTSARNEECFSCRRCLTNKCRYWKGRCKDILYGRYGNTGTEEEWLQCFSDCGQTLPSEEGGRFLERDSWCDCTLKCGNRCKKRTSVSPAL